MKIKILLMVIFLASTAGLRAATNDLTSLLQQGLFDEEANHDLTSAIVDYQSLATQFDRDRQLAATAIYRLGECYRKLGQTNEAISQYRRIVKDFADQQDLVTLSHQNLTGLGAGENQFQQRLTQIIKSTSQEGSFGHSESVAQYIQIQALEEELNTAGQQLEEARKQVQAGTLPAEAVSVRQKELDDLKRQLAALQDGKSNEAPVPNIAAEETSHMARQVEMVRKLEAMTNLNEVIQIAPTVLDDGILINLIDQYNITDLDLMRAGVAINTDPSTSHSADQQKIREDEALEIGISAKISARLAGLEKALTMELRDAGSRGIATPAGQTSDAPSSLGRIYVWGAVRTQGPIELRKNENLTAGEAILSAGGLGDFANKKQVKLFHATSGTNENKVTILDMEQILEQGDARKDVILKPGDHILVPSKLFNF